MIDVGGIWDTFFDLTERKSLLSISTMLAMRKLIGKALYQKKKEFFFHSAEEKTWLDERKEKKGNDKR